MSFSRQRAPGLFIDGSVVTGAEFEYWDAAIASAFDPVGGGAYALEDNVNIGGAPGIGWTFDLPVTCSEDVSLQQVSVGGFADFVGAASFQDAVQFFGAVEFNNDTDFGGNVYFHDGSFTIGFDTSDLLTVNAYTELQDANFLGDIAHNGSADYYGAATFHAAATLQGSTWFEGTVITNGAGNFRIRRVHRHTYGGDLDQTIDMTVTDHVIMRPGILSALRNYTISDTGTSNGDRVRFSNHDQSFGISVRNPGGTSLAVIGWFTGFPRWCDVEKIDGVWRAMPGDKEA